MTGSTHLCWLFSSSTEALRSLSWFLSSSRVRGVTGECRSSGEGLRPEEEDGEAGRWLEVGGARTEGLVGRGALPSGRGWMEALITDQHVKVIVILPELRSDGQQSKSLIFLSCHRIYQI